MWLQSAVQRRARPGTSRARAPHKSTPMHPHAKETNTEMYANDGKPANEQWLWCSQILGRDRPSPGGMWNKEFWAYGGENQEFWDCGACMWSLGIRCFRGCGGCVFFFGCQSRGCMELSLATHENRGFKKFRGFTDMELGISRAAKPSGGGRASRAVGRCAWA